MLIVSVISPIKPEIIAAMMKIEMRKNL